MNARAQNLKMNDLGKLLFFAGLTIAAVGLVFWFGFGRGWIGKLPGDVQFSRGSFQFYFPLATCLLFSVVLTLILWLFRR